MNVVSVVSLLLIRSSLLHADHHGHSHDVEAPHFKYTREANEEHSVHDSHGHSDHHGHDHDHGYHQHHEHSADHHYTHDHNHFHEKEHHHAHFSGGSDHHHHQQHIKSSQQNYKPYDPNGILSFMNDFQTRLWVYSIGSTLLISLMPFILLSLIPLQANTAENGPMLKVLLSFGSGGLLGDAFLHLIPHSQPSYHDGHEHSHDGSGHSHGPHDMTVGSHVLAGILTFLTVEKLVRILRSEKMIHSHSHSHDNGLLSSDDKKKIKNRGKGAKSSREKKSDVSSTEESLHNCSDEEQKHLTAKANDETGFKVAAYLNMAADFAHNFTDGLAIGASFLAGTTVGIVTMFTVLLHEIPHEIGDFAILVQSGFTKKKAMSVQLLTALGALTGCVLSLCSANADELSDAASSSWILPFTAGGFIYIATVTVIPELLENTSTWQSIKEVVALLAGIMLMFLIAAYE
uniref:Zinc transporter SLC39A7 n=1 Tax=Elaeophora elaphi TaxID=1147741 RepID=A0A0R3RYH8_9BILA